MFVGTDKAGLIRVDRDGATHLDASAPDTAELLALVAYKKSLVVIVRVEDKDHAFILDAKGNVLKTLALGIRHNAHPVLMDDRLYLVDEQEGKVITVNLKKMEIAASTDLPGAHIGSLTGVISQKQHALLMTLNEKDSLSGKVILFDPADGKYAPVCPVNHSHVDAICANGHIVIATGCSYQNMIRVFSMPVAAPAAKAA